jgi:hypothetical protein
MIHTKDFSGKDGSYKPFLPPPTREFSFCESKNYSGQKGETEIGTREIEKEMAVV